MHQIIAMMKKNVIFILIIVWISSSVKAQISESKFDYTELAKHITDGCNTQTEQARNIYQWICQNIAYDTNYQIYTADECYNKKKGVCQAYCELFYRLGETLGLKMTIISGRSKNLHGEIERVKHAWLLVEADGNGILIDPTWGAGTVKEGSFVFSSNDMSWFQIDPYWLLFTHFPDNPNHQCIENPIDWKTFIKLPVLYPSSKEYGWNGKDIFTRILNGNIQSVPRIYDQYSAFLSLEDIPIQKTLKAGHKYTFTLQKKMNNELVLIHDGEFIHECEWQQNEDMYKLEYMPVAAGNLVLGIAKADKKYTAVVTYQVSAPTSSEKKYIETHFPLRMPEIKKLKNFDLKGWKTIEANAHEILNTVRQQKITSLPILYKKATNYLRGVVIPFTETLKKGQSYTFSFIPLGGLDWQIINAKDWYGDWLIDEKTGRHTMTITPQATGKFRLSVQLKENGPYESILGYQVK